MINKEFWHHKITANKMSVFQLLRIIDDLEEERKEMFDSGRFNMAKKYDKLINIYEEAVKDKYL